MTRAEFMVVLHRFLNIEITFRTVGSVFSDLRPEDWYYSAVMSAYENGWIQGFGDGTVRGELPVTRAQAATALNRLLDRSRSPEDYAHVQSPFADLPSDHWAYGDILGAAGYGA